MKIGIMTFHYSNNYGALLQTYALMEILRKLGHEPIIINRIPVIIGDRNILFGMRNKISSFIKFPVYKAFYKFRKKYLSPITAPILTNKDHVKYIYDAVIVGSDQVWRLDYTSGLGLNNFLDFVPDNVLKISYAASFGNDTFVADEETIGKIKSLLHRFNAISVREETGVNLCKEIFNIDATRTLDPTLLLEPHYYDKIIPNNIIDPQKYIATYILDPTNDKKKFAESIAAHMQRDLKNVYRKSVEDFSLRKLNFLSKKYFYPTVGNWLSGIKNADFIVTDSFHGVIFSLIYKKQFICIANEKRGLSRLIDLMEIFDIKERLIFIKSKTTKFSCILEPIDYIKIDSILEIEKIKSIEYLKTSISIKI